MKKIIAAGILILASSMASAKVTKETTSFELQKFVSCANNEQGEAVDVAGTITFTTSQNFVNGRIIGFLQVRGNFAGIGEVTGDQYTAKDFSQQTFKIDPQFGESGHFIMHSLVKGDGSKLQLRDSFQYLFSPDGSTLTISHENFDLTCQ